MLKRYTAHTPQVVIWVPDQIELQVVQNKVQHDRLQGFLVELAMYNCVWKVGINTWNIEHAQVELPLIEEIGDLIEQIKPPTYVHPGDYVVVKGKEASSEEVHAPDEGEWVAYFDGGAA